MTDIRMLVSWGQGSSLTRDWFSNTLYFSEDNVGTEPDYQDLANDLVAVYQARSFTSGCKIEVRAYNLADAKPRPEKAYATVTKTGALPQSPAQVALCLSYYSERNLPRQRGRIYTGPYDALTPRPSTAQMNELITFGQALAGIGGLNVDWSVYSPTKASLGEDPTMSISDIWVDNSWDVIRSRKLRQTARTTAEVNE